jgi:hypothetical protein
MSAKGSGSVGENVQITLLGPDGKVKALQTYPTGFLGYVKQPSG